MPLLESIRRRLSHTLESHHVEEDYSPRNGSRQASGNISRNSTSNSVVLNENIVYDRNGTRMSYDSFDPHEDVPSYEYSQLIHEQQPQQSGNNTPNHHPHTHPQSQPQNHSQSHSIINHHSTPNPSRSASRLQPVAQINTQINNENGALNNSNTVSRRSSVLAPSVSETSDNNNNHNNSNGSSVNGANNNNTTTTNNNNKSKNDNPNNLKNLGLKFLNAKQHFLLACCRDLSLVPCLIGLIQSWKQVFVDANIVSYSITRAKLPEHFLTGIWCIVAGYLSFSVLDGLMIRWIVTYSTSAAILRMLSMSTIIVTIEQYLLSSLSADGYKYGLHIWILISCCLTLVYIVQNFVTLNLDLRGKRRARFFDFYNIVVFAVVPVGLASFITMIGLLRSLLIVRLDIENNCQRTEI